MEVEVKLRRAVEEATRPGNARRDPGEIAGCGADRLGHVESIAEAYDALVQEAMGKVEVDVYTVSGPPLGDELEATISARVRESIGKEPILRTHADPSMIGGIKLRIGDQLIDGSIATRLRRMRTRLKERGGSAILEHSERFLSGDGA